MSGKDEIRRRALQERIRLAEQDISDLRQQVDDGELDETTAASLEDRYRTDLDALRKSLAGMPKPKKAPQGAKPVPMAAGAKSTTSRNALIIGAAAAAMVLLTVVIVVLATGGDGGAPTEAATPAQGIPQPGTGSVADLEAAVAAQPDNNPMRLALAGLYFDGGDYMNAMNHYSAVTGSNPTAAEGSTANARIGWMAFTALDDSETAVAFLDAAIEMDAANHEATLWKGMVLLYGIEDGEAAVPYFEQILALDGLSATTRADVETMLAEAQGGGG